MLQNIGLCFARRLRWDRSTPDCGSSFSGWTIATGDGPAVSVVSKLVAVFFSPYFLLEPPNCKLRLLNGGAIFEKFIYVNAVFGIANIPAFSREFRREIFTSQGPGAFGVGSPH